MEEKKTTLMQCDIQELLSKCVFTDDEMIGLTAEEKIAKCTITEGIMFRMGFDPARIEAHRDTINDLIDDLPEEFTNGYSFLAMCHDKNGNLWSGEHRTMEVLMCLGMAIGRIRYSMDKPYWRLLPGGMPYITVLPKK